MFVSQFLVRTEISVAHFFIERMCDDDQPQLQRLPVRHSLRHSFIRHPSSSSTTKSHVALIPLPRHGRHAPVPQRQQQRERLLHDERVLQLLRQSDGSVAQHADDAKLLSEQSEFAGSVGEQDAHGVEQPSSILG